MAQSAPRLFARGFATISPPNNGVRFYRWEIFDSDGRSAARGECFGGYDEAANHALGLLEQMRNRNLLEELNTDKSPS